MVSDDDLSLWQQLIAGLKPLSRRKAIEPSPFPKRLRVHPVPERELMFTLDLHGKTVEEAYRMLRRFLTLHVRENSKKIVIVTGKGSSNKEGLIHREILNWLDTPFFSSKINQVKWLNGGGAIEIALKRQKKK